jgi:PAS domain S-box-containing protein
MTNTGTAGQAQRTGLPGYASASQSQPNPSPTIQAEEYQAILDQAGDGVFLADSEGRFVQLNLSASELLEHSPQELLGRRVEEVLPLPLSSVSWKTAARSGAKRKYQEVSLRRRNGAVLPAEVSISRIVARDRVFFLGILRDVSARKQLEADLRRRGQELYVLNSLANVMSRSLSPHQVLSRGLDKVLSLLGIEAGYIVLLNDETGRLEIAVHRGLSSAFVNEYSRRPLRLAEGITGHVFVTGEPVLSRDASADPRVTRAVVRRDGLKSSLNVPLRAQDRILGVLMVVSSGIREFSAWDIQVLTTIGSEMGVYLENSRLYRDERERSREVLSLLHLSNELNQQLESDGLLQFVTEKARELVDCQAAAAALVEENCARGCWLLGQRRRRTTWFAGPFSGEDVSRAHDPPRLVNYRRAPSLLSVPMRDSHGTLLGLIQLYGRTGRREFSRKDTVLISGLAAQAAIAFEKSRLFRQMKHERDFAAQIVDNLASGLIATDTAGIIERVNRRAAEMVGVPEEQLRGQPVSRWVAVGERVNGRLAWTVPLETELRLASGGSIPVQVTGSLRVDDSGRAVGSMLVLEDLQQIRLLKSKERERERLATIGEVVAGIAHEIRNPLFGISSVAQILQMEGATLAEHRPLLDALLAETERMNRMVEELLFYGRPATLATSTVDLEAIWRSILLLNSNEIETRRLRVETAFSEARSPIKADPGRLRQLFLNLLKNAMEATPPGGSIRIEVKPSRGGEATEGVLVVVQDDGSGIMPEKLGRIFDLFYSDKRGGSGLGLPICKKIVEDHGGHIGVESCLGQGSRFTTWLPAAPRRQEI